MQHQYAQAAAEVLEGGMPIDTVLNRLQHVLAEHGHKKQYPEILRNLLETVETKASSESAMVLVAQTDDVKRLAEPIAAALQELQVPEDPRVVLTPQIIGGFIVRYKGIQIDRSYKRQLLDVYQAVV